MTSYGGTGPGEYKMSTSAIEPQVSDRLGCSSVVPRTNRDKERLLANRDRWGREIAKNIALDAPHRETNAEWTGGHQSSPNRG